ncbi:MAG: NUDIX hydrolase [Hyphomicrobiales bacterium]
MKIKDASSLILVNRRGDCPRILMGRRSAKHQFMPSVYVFPGGRVDYADRFAPFGRDYTLETLDLLLQQMKGRPTALRARMLGLAAIRETYEEVGLMLGASANTKRQYNQPLWNAFNDRGMLPDLSSLTYIARAITPPGHNRRFDTRFFMVNADQYLNDQAAHSSDELEDVQWLSFDQTEDMPIHFITRQIIEITKAAIEHQDNHREPPKVAFYRAKMGADNLAKIVTYLRAGKEPLDGGELLVQNR